MKVSVFPADQYACGHYRMVWPARATANCGVDVELVEPGGHSGIKLLVVDGKAQSISLPDVDVVVFQRPARKTVADMIPMIRAKGIAVVVDIDDDLERIHPRNPAFAGMHPRQSPGYNWEHVRRACRAATLVTVSTPALMPRYGSHGRVRLLRNYVPESFLSVEHDTALNAPGWAGSAHSHPEDLRQASQALSRLASEGHELKFVGPYDGLEQEFGAEVDESSCTGELPFGEWQPAIAARIGVGVAPLAPSSFNEAKSWLKPLEYASAGVPCVSSNTQEYRYFAKLCGASLASKPKEWYRELKLLASDDALRAEASGRARAAAAGLTIEKHGHLWAEAWEDAVQIERGATAPHTRRVL